MQNSGTLTELPLRDILERMQKERATGTLRVRGDAGEATLYFLFGHLFHAVDQDRQGEDVVFDALNWGQGDFTFDSKAKLPAEETIKVPTAEILSRFAPTEAAPVNGASANGVAEAEVEAEPEPEPEPEPAPVFETQAVAAEPEAVAEPVVEEAAPEPEATAPEPEPEPAVEAEPARQAPAVAAFAEPEAKGPRRRKTDQRPGTRPPESMQLYPVPMGKAIHAGLTTGFIDFPKLLRTLSKDNLTGYIRLYSDDMNGVLIFSSGAAVEAIYDRGGSVSTGKAAFDLVNGDIDEGNGALDVIQLDPEMVTAIFQLLTAPSIYDKLVARWVKVDALLDFLNDAGASGSVIVRSGVQSGIVLLREGRVLGAYTDQSREINESPAKVLELANEPTAEIEVRGGPVPASLPVMDPGKGPASVPATQARAAAPEPEATHPAESEPDADGVDWDGRVAQMAGRADEVLGTRSKKVKEMLYATPHDRTAMHETLDRVAELSIMFVDPAKLTALADEMRAIAAG